ncbi:MAG TPA: lysostaphin resistance A-like protein [Cyclobacteriaceae bacterium]
MDNNGATFPFPRQNAWLSLLVLVCFCVVALFAFTILSQFIVFPLFGFNLMENPNLLMPPFNNEEIRLPILVLQGLSSFGAFILAPLLFIKIYQKGFLDKYIKFPKENAWYVIGLVLVITMSFMFVNSVFIEWNKEVAFPDFLKGFEAFAKDKENELEQLTRFITTFGSVNEFLLGLLVIAIIPAIGEELLFRGLIQNHIYKISSNPHVAIWFTGLMFGAFHFQFYGMIPRMMLGVLFGYLYLWSGKLPLAMIAHFINNAFSIVMIYFYQKGISDVDPESTENLPLHIVLLFLLVGGFATYRFIRFHKTHSNG